ncbi:MAG: hypothetical protein HY266_06025 [Deltaproteobacteria bacterium]|nr:hypothetical protein [Deltaproteobacteria bacterium]
MKKMSIIVAALCAMFFANVTSSSFAEEEKGSGVSFSVGYKAWLNTWLTSYTKNVSQSGANITTITSDGVVASIPTISLKIENFFISGSYFLSTAYNFPAYTETIQNVSGAPSTSTAYTLKTEASAKRNELDLNIGYYFHPAVAVTVGYKQVGQEYTTKASGTGLVTTTSQSTTTYTGPTIGIMGIAPIGGGFMVYGNGAYGIMKAKYTGSSDQDNASYGSSELGFMYRPADWIMFNLGYKYQYINTDVTTNNPSYSGYNKLAPDVTQGYILGANLIF